MTNPTVRTTYSYSVLVRYAKVNVSLPYLMIRVMKVFILGSGLSYGSSFIKGTVVFRVVTWGTLTGTP